MTNTEIKIRLEKILVRNEQRKANKLIPADILDIKDIIKQLSICDVVSSAFLVQHKETLINYGLFSTREKAENYINKNTDLFGIQEVKIA